MAEPFLAEIRMFGFNFAPRGWALCDGQIMPIDQNQSLFSLLGTIYGGNGRTDFALPDLRGRVPIHEDNSFPLGSHGGEERHALTVAEMPRHRHSVRARSADSNSEEPADNLPCQTEDTVYFSGSSPSLVSMGPGTIGNNSGGQGHENMQPVLTLNFAIAISGIFPPRN